jgi:pyruvate kinase
LIGNNQKRTKVVATIGPASHTDDKIRALIRAGMDVARVNFSHGDHKFHAETFEMVRRIAKEENAVVAILSDIQGPKIRLGDLAAPIELKKGDRITLTLDESANGTNNVVPLPHPEFLRDIREGTILMLDDGNIQFKVTSALPRSLICESLTNGLLKQRKGVSAPNATLTLSAITDEDRDDIKFALEQGTDFIAMSFVRRPDDIDQLRFFMRHAADNANSVGIIAKIEMREALETIDAIIDAADGVMVARGDLGVELEVEAVPFQQKRIIRLANAAGKPVITATQMLESMTGTPRPTRAEATDVYNAVLDGTDAVMLSAESASGLYPVEAVETMNNITSMADNDKMNNRAAHLPTLVQQRESLRGHELVSDSVAQATWQVADLLNAAAILTISLSGYTTRQVARARPKTPIICVTPSRATYQQTALLWGAFPLLVNEDFDNVDDMVRVTVKAAYDAKLVRIGDKVVITAGIPFGKPGQTNFLKVHEVGEAGEIDS